MTAESIAAALGGRRGGRGWIARCPAHNDRSPSLSICDAGDGKVLVHCHAGCEQVHVIDVLRSRGLWEPGDRRPGEFIHRQPLPPSRDQRGHEVAGRIEAARAIWKAAVPAVGTPVETYLVSRGLNLPLTPTLRFHAELKHPVGGMWPAMVSLVTCGTDNEPVGIHRTFLSQQGGGKAPVKPQKMMLGPCSGGAVRLGAIQAGRWLLIGEGIETTLSVMQACELPGWAALSATGIKSLVLPAAAAMVLICADNDSNGTGERAANDAGERFLREGRKVRIAMPPSSGTDFNDVFETAAVDHAEGEVRHVG
ncbi:MAG: toprim domain-containing protein [Hyphomicrobiales bacterium]